MTVSFKQALRTYIIESFSAPGRPLDGLGDGESLINRGVLDSMAVLQLMTFVEEQTGVRVPDHEVVLDNFESIDRIDGLVERLRAARRE